MYKYQGSACRYSYSIILSPTYPRTNLHKNHNNPLLKVTTSMSYYSCRENKLTAIGST